MENSALAWSRPVLDLEQGQPVPFQMSYNGQKPAKLYVALVCG